MELIIFDTLRIVAALCALGVVGMTPFALVRRRMAWGQMARFIGASAIGVAVIHSYLTSLGTVPASPWRLVVISLGLIVSVAGWASFLWVETSSTSTRHRR